MEVITTVAL